MVKRILVVVTLALTQAVAARASTWQAPRVTLRLEGVSSSDLFPGDLRTGADRGAAAVASTTTSVRLPAALKLGLDAHAGGQAFMRFAEADRYWMGTEASVRHRGSQLVAGGDWTPRRVKFPAEPRDAAFARLDGRLGLRQALPANLRLRLDGQWIRDDYIADFDARDGRDRYGEGQLAWQATPDLALRYAAGLGRATASDPRYTNEYHDAGGGIAWHGSQWQLAASVRSGVRRYTQATPSQTNYRRRDQWIETRAAVGRALQAGLTAVAGAVFVDQTSSRLDRAYTVYTVRFGLEWRGSSDEYRDSGGRREN